MQKVILPILRQSPRSLARVACRAVASNSLTRSLQPATSQCCSVLIRLPGLSNPLECHSTGNRTIFDQDEVVQSEPKFLRPAANQQRLRLSVARHVLCASLVLLGHPCGAQRSAHPLRNARQGRDHTARPGALYCRGMGRTVLRPGDSAAWACGPNITWFPFFTAEHCVRMLRRKAPECDASRSTVSSPPASIASPMRWRPKRRLYRQRPPEGASRRRWRCRASLGKAPQHSKERWIPPPIPTENLRKMPLLEVGILAASAMD